MECGRVVYVIRAGAKDNCRLLACEEETLARGATVNSDAPPIRACMSGDCKLVYEVQIIVTGETRDLHVTRM